MIALCNYRMSESTRSLPSSPTGASAAGCLRPTAAQSAPQSTPAQSGVPSVGNGLGTGSGRQGQLHRLNIFVLVRILFHYLEKVDPKLLLQAKQVLKECDKRKKAGDPEFQQLADCITPRIRAVVGDAHWTKALTIQRQFLKNKQRQTRQATSPGGSGINRAGSGGSLSDGASAERAAARAGIAQSAASAARARRQQQQQNAPTSLLQLQQLQQQQSHGGRSLIVMQKFAKAGVLGVDLDGRPLAPVKAPLINNSHRGVRKAPGGLHGGSTVSAATEASAHSAASTSSTSSSNPFLPAPLYPSTKGDGSAPPSAPSEESQPKQTRTSSFKLSTPSQDRSHLPSLEPSSGDKRSSRSCPATDDRRNNLNERLQQPHKRMASVPAAQLGGVLSPPAHSGIHRRGSSLSDVASKDEEEERREDVPPPPCPSPNLPHPYLQPPAVRPSMLPLFGVASYNQIGVQPMDFRRRPASEASSSEGESEEEAEEVEEVVEDEEEVVEEVCSGSEDESDG